MGSNPSMQPRANIGATQRPVGGTSRVSPIAYPDALPVGGVIARIELFCGRKNDLVPVVHQMDGQRWAALGDDAKAGLVRDDAPGRRGLEFAVGLVLAKQFRIGDPAGAAADAGGLVDVEFLDHGRGDGSKAAGQWVGPQIVAQQPAPLTLTDRNLSAIDAIQPVPRSTGVREVRTRQQEDRNQ
jgi:hypothetical protein